MYQRILGAALLWLGWQVVASCAIDERDVQLAFPIYGDASTPAPGEQGDAVARIEVAPTAVDLGWVTVGFPSRARVQLRNAGSVALTPPAIDWSSNVNGDFELIQNQCLGELAPGTSCEVRVQLIPKVAGNTSAVLRVESATAGSADVSFTGLGLEGGDLILAPAAGSFEDFGGVLLGATVQGVFNVSNPTATPSGPLALQTNRSEFALLPSTGDVADCVLGVTSLVNGQSCNVRIAFTPLERGPVEATLTTRTDGAGSVSATLAGQGLLPGVLAASFASLDFDGVVLGDGMPRGVTFANQGDQTLTLAGTSLEPATAEGFSILTSDCGAGRALAGGESCGVQVEFRPPRVAEELTAELVTLAVEGEQRQAVALRGIGLEPGALVVSPAAEGENDYGGVLLESSLVRTFQVTNPGMQPSGVLTFTTSEGFELVTPPLEGECVPGSTSLVDGQSCNVRVTFTPTRREIQQGSLTVSSELAGANSLPLIGQGIIAAAFEVEPEINFGDVFINAPAARTLVVRNAGDEPLPPPVLSLSSTSGAQASAFAYESACTEPLAFGEQCDIIVRFTPTEAVPHSANLSLTAQPGGSATVLLLAEALTPGSLVLAAQGGSADFGDVPVQTTSTRTFTLTNPGNERSGLLSIRTDSNRFEVTLGDCNAGDPDGLVDGASCTFTVAFTPDTALEVVANLSVQSPGAGQTGLELRGRGRALPTLTATGNRNLGRANIGQDTLTQPENQFTWTVSNEGDLASGVLRVTNSNATEFERTNDSCNNAPIAGRGSCQMTLRFRPSDTGTRSANVVVTDMTNMRSTTLALTGTGVRLAQLGQSCVNATCAAGVCTGGVCCDRACAGGCQDCSAAGVCIDQSNREACGNGSGRCFGVDRCLLPEGLTCGQNGDCGLGNCERRLGGTGANDRICCAADCEATGQQCNAQGQCQQPTLGDGALCGRAGDLPCGGNLQCKRCLDGANRCTPPGTCCGGCTAPYVCIDGQSCGCPIGANNRRMIDCGAGECIIDRELACCVGSPRCPTNAPVCDGNGDLCRQCLTANDCPVGAAGTRRQCTNTFTCAYTCDTQQGFKDCGNTRCVLQNDCCGDNDCGPCARCNAQNDCAPLTAGQADRCPGANEVCDAQQSCIEQRALGQTCGAANQVCTQSSCLGGRCCPGATCPNGCRNDGTCTCPNGATFQNGACVCGPALNLCTSPTSTLCNNNFFGFETGLEGWEARAGTVSAPAICGDAFSTCLQAVTLGNSAAFAHGGQGFISGLGTLVAGAVRRLSLNVNLCGLPGSTATTSLVGQTISGYMQTGSQGGSFPGNLFTIAITDGRSTPIIIGTTDAATTGGAQNTGWRLVSGVVPDNAIGRSAMFAIMSMELAPTQNTISFSVDDVQIGD